MAKQPWPEGMENDIAKLQDEDDFNARTQGDASFDFGVGSKWFEVDGLPVRMLSPTAIPERLDPKTGQWEPLANFMQKLTFEARKLSEEQFNQLVAHQTPKG